MFEGLVCIVVVFENILKIFQVHVTTNDTVTASSCPFRHAASLAKLVKETTRALLKMTDGGTDQRNNIKSVQLSNICICKELGLDFLCHIRCCPGHSWTNQAERLMALLNLALQNLSLERKEGSADFEKLIKNANSTAAVRKIVTAEEERKQEWISCMKPVIEQIEERFSRLKLKDEPIQVMKFLN